jgi:hypothetical protein
MSKEQESRVRKMLVLSCAGIAGLAITQSSKAQVNLLVDPSFELMTGSPTGVGGWGTFNGAVFSGAEHHTGVESMYTPAAAGNYTVPGAYQIVPGVPGDTYTLSGWVFTPATLATGSNSFAILQISWYQTPTGGTAAGAVTTAGVDVGTPAGTPPANTVSILPGTWTFASITAVDPTSTPPSGPGGLGVGAYLLNINPPAPNNNDFYFDDISLVDDSAPIPEPASLSLVGLPLLGLALRRRKN